MRKQIKRGIIKSISSIWFLIATIFFVVVIFLPAVYILSYVFKAGNIFTPEIVKAIMVSFEIGIIVVLVDFIFGLPLAWILTKSKSKLVKVLDSLIDLSLVIPTAALGFSVYLYWGSKYGLAYLLGWETGLFSQGPILIILLHIVFTLPYMIRSIAAAIVKIDLAYEQAALTLGANPVTVFRTIYLPLFKDGIIVGSILSFTRSLSETGATMMVAGTFATAPILIVGLKQAGEIPQAAGASIIMILSAIIILFVSKLFLGQKKISLEKVYPSFEKSLIKLKTLRNIFLAAFFIFIIFLPTTYLVIFNLANLQTFFSSLLIKSLAISFFVAFVVTLINLFFSAPIAYLIAHNKFRLGKLLDSLNEVVLLVPTSALGLSLVLFWQHFLAYEFIILILTHLSFSFPLLVKPLIAAFKHIPLELEEAAYSLGANKRKMFITILLPLIKPALIAGSIMAFMRSLSETGATLAVSDKFQTIPVLIVELVKQGDLNQAGFVSVILFVIAFVFLIILKHNKFSKN
ncbi:ABC transporter permease [Patescibacteria group bacterium]